MTAEEADRRAKEAEERADLERTIANERIKLRATILNLIGVGFVVTGVIAPMAQWLETKNPAAGLSEIAGHIAFMCVLAAFAMHGFGRWSLGALR